MESYDNFSQADEKFEKSRTRERTSHSTFALCRLDNRDCDEIFPRPHCRVRGRY